MTGIPAAFAACSPVAIDDGTLASRMITLTCACTAFSRSCTSWLVTWLALPPTVTLMPTDLKASVTPVMNDSAN